MPAPAVPPLSVADMARLGQHWQECRPRLFAMLRRRIDPAVAVRVDAEEVLNDTFLDAARDWGRFDAQTAVSAYPWLYRLALDRLIATWRRETGGGRDRRRDLPWPDESSVQLGLHLMDPGTSPSEAVARGELRGRVQQALAQLKGDDRELLWLRQAEQLPFAELGQVFGVSENAATVRYVRALRRLKALLTAADAAGGGG